MYDLKPQILYLGLILKLKVIMLGGGIDVCRQS